MAAGGAGPDGNSDAYLWTGVDGTNWGTAGNWTDATTGMTPAAPPGATNAVTVEGTPYGTTDITGTGASASLTLNNSVALGGQFTTGALVVEGSYATLSLDAADTLAVSGAATVEADSAIDLAGTGAGLSVAGTLTLGTAGSYGGGTVSVSGGGAVSAAGLIAASPGDISVDQTSSINVGGANDASAGSFTIDQGATATLNGYLTAPTLTLNGTLRAGDLTLSVGALTGDGVIDITGTLGVQGDGYQAFSGGAQVGVAFGGAGEALSLFPDGVFGPQTFAPKISGFAAGDQIDWGGTLTGVAFAHGKLTLSNDGTVEGTLHLAGHYAHESFVVVPVTYAGSEIVVVGAGDTKTAPAGTSTPDSYVWNGAISGSWDSAADWTDSSVGAGPAAVAPGANDTVTIDQIPNSSGYPSTAVTVISGKGSAATLNLNGVTLLDGSFTAGTLNLAEDAGDLLLQAGNEVNVSGNAVLGGFDTIAVAGAGAAFTVGGTLAIGTGQFGAGSGTLAVSNGGSMTLRGLNAAVGADITVDPNSALQVGYGPHVANGTFEVSRNAAATVAGYLSADALVVNGTLAASGTLQINSSAISGSGTIDVLGSLSFMGTPSFATGLAIDFDNSAGTLTLDPSDLNAAGTFAPTIAGFGSGDVLNFDDFEASGVSFANGTLTLTAAYGPSATLTLSGDYRNDSFLLLPGYSTEVVLVGPGDTKTPPPGTSSADDYDWRGASIGSWDVAANWNDTSAGGYPAAVAPGANDAVTLGSEFYYGTTDVISGTGDAASLTVDGDYLLAGQFSAGALGFGQSDTTLYLDTADTLAVSGAAALGFDTTIDADGAGAQFTAGTLTLPDGLYITAAIYATNGGLARFDTLSGGSDLTLLADQNSSIEIGSRGHAALGAVTVDRGVSFGLAGSIEAPSLVVNGTIVANGLTVSAGTLSGTGTIEIGTTLDMNNDVANAQTGGNGLTIGFGGADEVLDIGLSSLDGNANFEPVISGFGDGDVIDWAGQLTQARFSAGTLTLSNQGSIEAVLHLAGNYAGLNFVAVASPYGGTEVLVVGQGDTKTPPPGTTTADTYAWNNPVAGSWDSASFWSDDSTGANPAAVAPGKNDAVIIGAPNFYGSGTDVITGTGDAASLTVTSAVLFDGIFSTGSLNFNSFGGQMDLGAGNTLSVSGTALVEGQGSVAVSGAGGSFVVDGTLTLGSTLAQDAYYGQIDVSQGGAVKVAALNELSGSIDIDASSSFQVGLHGQAPAAGSFAVLYGQSATASGGVITAPTVSVNGTLDAGGVTIATNQLTGQGTIVVTGSLGLGADGASSIAGGGALTIAFDPGGILGIGPSALDSTGAFLPTLSGFTAGNAIAWGGPVTSAVENGGTLTLYDTAQGTTTAVGTLSVTGDYSGQSFVVAQNASGQAEIVVVGAGDTASPPAGTATADDYVWNGAISGSWDSAGDWQDVSAGQSPAGAAPGANDLVTINAVALNQYDQATVVISGAGAAAALTDNADALLDGSFTAGTLNDASTLSVGAAGTLAVTGTATVGQFATLSAVGAAAALTVAGTLTIGAAYAYGAAAVTAGEGGSIEVGGLQGYSDAIVTVGGNASFEVGRTGHAAAGSFTVDQGASAMAQATIEAPDITVNGFLSGDLSLEQTTLSGTGVLSIGSGDELTLGQYGSPVTGGADVTIAFTGTGGTLSLSKYSLNAGGLLGPGVAGFGGGNAILWSSGKLTGASYSAATGKLSLLDGNKTVGTLKLDGSYAGETFAVGTDGFGETMVTVTPQAGDVAPGITAPAAVSAVVGTAAPVGGVSITDAGRGAGSATFTVVLTDAAGIFSASTGANGGGGTISGGGSSQMIITGLLSQVNADLSTLGFLSSVAGSDGITVAVNDGMGAVTDGLIGVTVAAGLAAALAPPVPATDGAAPGGHGLLGMLSEQRWDGGVFGGLEYGIGLGHLA
jgi:hypothetical protein